MLQTESAGLQLGTPRSGYCKMVRLAICFSRLVIQLNLTANICKYFQIEK